MYWLRLDRIVTGGALLVVAACTSGALESSGDRDDDDALGPVSAALNDVFAVTAEFDVLDYAQDELVADVSVTNISDVERELVMGGCPFQFTAYADPDRGDRIWRQEIFQSPQTTARRGCPADARGWSLAPQESVLLQRGVWVAVIDDIVGGRPPQTYYFSVIMETLEPVNGRLGEFPAGTLTLPRQ